MSWAVRELTKLAQIWAGHKRRFTATPPDFPQKPWACTPLCEGRVPESILEDMPAPREDAQAAVAAIAAAGNDTEALAEAIEKAAFLDETPGENRQTLRGRLSSYEHNQKLQLRTFMPCTARGSGAISPNAAARTKLKKIFTDERKKKEMAEADAIANRSPHKKEVCDRNFVQMPSTSPQYILLSHWATMALTP